MLFSRKSELESYKKQRAELLREEKRMIKALQEEEVRLEQQSRRDQMSRIKELEDKLIEELDSRARRTRNSSLDHSVNSSYRSLSNSHNEHLIKMREIHEKARNLLNGQSYLEEIPEKVVPKRTESPVISPIKIPVMIPQSMLRKAQNLPPPTVQRTLKNGEIITVHLLSNNSRINDPLVKAEAQLDQKDINSMSIQSKGKPMKQLISEIQTQLQDHDTRSQSMPLTKKDTNYIKLPESEITPVRDSTTPIGRPEYYMFRDLALDVVSQQSTRTWVSQRMKQYSDKVKKNYVPKPSQKKEIEMQILKEKLNHHYPIITNRVKLLN
jgi:hypothetical protein